MRLLNLFLLRLDRAYGVRDITIVNSAYASGYQAVDTVAPGTTHLMLTSISLLAKRPALALLSSSSSSRFYSIPSAPLFATAASTSASTPPSSSQAASSPARPSVAKFNRPMQPSLKKAASTIFQYSLSSSGSGRTTGRTTPVITEDDIWLRCSNAINAAGAYPLTTTASRSLGVGNANVAVAFRRLNRILTENNVRREVKRGERFEGRSDKRVRLNSERHRKRYKVAVGKAVGQAIRMKD